MKVNTEKLEEKFKPMKRYHNNSFTTTSTTTTTQNKKQKITTSIYYNNNSQHQNNLITPKQTIRTKLNLTSTTTSPSESPSTSIQIIASSSSSTGKKTFQLPSYLTQSAAPILRNNRSQPTKNQYSKKPTMFGVHDKTSAVRRKLEWLKQLATSWNNPSVLQNLSFTSILNSQSPLVDLHPIKNTLIETLAQHMPVNEYRNQIKDINKADNDARIREAHKRNQRLSSFSEKITRTSDATLDTPRPPEPCLPTYQQIRERQNLLDLTFGKRKIRKRNWRKSLDLDQLTLVQKTLARPAGLISELASGGYIQAHDIQKLRPRQWINDEIITFYTVLINERSVELEKLNSTKKKLNGFGDDDDEDGKILKSHCFNSFFMPKYDKAGYDGVKRWTKKVDLLSKDIIIFPLNIGNAHWTCGAINMRAKRFEYFDSMGHQNPSVLANLREYITHEALAKKNITLDTADWPDFYYSNLPQQNNSFDCGIFVCQFMDCLSRDWSFNYSNNSKNKLDQFNTTFDFDQSNMDYIRTKMVYEIVTKKFLKEEWI